MKFLYLVLAIVLTLPVFAEDQKPAPTLKSICSSNCARRTTKRNGSSRRIPLLRGLPRSRPVGPTARAITPSASSPITWSSGTVANWQSSRASRKRSSAATTTRPSTTSTPKSGATP